MSTASFFASKKSKRPFLQLREVYYAAAAFPEHAELIPKTSIFRCDGTCIWDDTADMPEHVQGSRIPISNKAYIERDGGRAAWQHSVLLMIDPTSVKDPQADVLIWITALADVFGVSTYSKTEIWVAAETILNSFTDEHV
jgi:CCR4-NOT transcriptional complex subunit CAF120